MEREEIIGHIRSAIDLEKKGIEKFSEFRDKSQNDYTRLVFDRLIKEEETHLEFFENLLDEVSKNEIEGKEEAFGTIKELYIFPETDKKITENYIAALSYTVEMEEKTYKFYKTIAQESKDPYAKSVFEKMAEYEKRHFDIFKKELEYAQATSI